MNAPHAWAYRLAMTAMISVTAAVIVITGATYLPRSSLTIVQPMQIIPQPVVAGAWIKVDVQYEKSGAIDSLLGIMLANEGMVYAAPAALTALPPGAHRIYLLVQVPSALPPGKYVVYLVKEHVNDFTLPWLSTRVNPLVAVSEPFEVIAP